MPGIRDGYKYDQTAGNGDTDNNGNTNNGDREGETFFPTEETSSEPERALNEPFWTFQDCYYRERNKGLYTADRLNPNNEDQLRAITTRQNPNGDRHGLECPEEQDYYPGTPPCGEILLSSPTRRTTATSTALPRKIEYSYLLPCLRR